MSVDVRPLSLAVDSGVITRRGKHLVVAAWSTTPVRLTQGRLALDLEKAGFGEGDRVRITKRESAHVSERDETIALRDAQVILATERLSQLKEGIARLRCPEPWDSGDCISNTNGKHLCQVCLLKHVAVSQ
jgi:hypothetical protein